MFIVIIDFPPIQPGKDAEFREWFIQTSDEFGKHEGFHYCPVKNQTKSIG